MDAESREVDVFGPATEEHHGDAHPRSARIHVYHRGNRRQRAAGKVELPSAFDGSESPVTGHPLIDAVIASSTGNGATVRYKRAGVVITTTTSTVSDDGRTLFVTMNVPDGKGGEITSVAVYERQ